MYVHQSFGKCYGGSARKESEGLKELIDDGFGLLELATNAGTLMLFIVYNIRNPKVCTVGFN